MTTSRTYVKSEVVGSSDKSVSDAIESAIATASRKKLPARKVRSTVRVRKPS